MAGTGRRSARSRIRSSTDGGGEDCSLRGGKPRPRQHCHGSKGYGKIRLLHFDVKFQGEHNENLYWGTYRPHFFPRTRARCILILHMGAYVDFGNHTDEKRPHLDEHELRILSALHHYSKDFAEDGLHRDRAEAIYDDLKGELIRNVVRNYHETGNGPLPIYLLDFTNFVSHV